MHPTSVSWFFCLDLPTTTSVASAVRLLTKGDHVALSTPAAGQNWAQEA
jgi:hypothetical protein